LGGLPLGPCQRGLIREQVFFSVKSGKENYYTQVTPQSICVVIFVQLLKIHFDVEEFLARRDRDIFARKRNVTQIEYVLRCRGNMAHIIQPRPDSGLGSGAQVLNTFAGVPCSLGSGHEMRYGNLPAGRGRMYIYIYYYYYIYIYKFISVLNGPGGRTPRRRCRGVPRPPRSRASRSARSARGFSSVNLWEGVTTIAKDAQGKPTQSHISPSILVHGEKAGQKKPNFNTDKSHGIRNGSKRRK